MNNNYKKGIRVFKDEVFIGKIYSDNSFAELVRLYVDKANIFQMEFLMGSDIAYTFLGECTELMSLLRDGICGVSLERLGKELIKRGYEQVN